MVEIFPVILVLLRVTSLLLSQGFSWILMFFGIVLSSMVSLEVHFTQQNTVSLKEHLLSLALPLFRQHDQQPPQHLPSHFLIVLYFLIQSPIIINVAKVKTI